MIVSNNELMASSHRRERTGENIPMSEIKLPGKGPEDLGGGSSGVIYQKNSSK